MSNRANLIQTVGLVTNQNELDCPVGSLKRALNVNINERGVITPRRGFNDYGNATDTNTIRIVKQIMEYRDRIFRHFHNKLQYEDETGTFKDISGTYKEVRAGYRTKYATSKGNLYFTTDSGIRKISVKGNFDLSSTSNVKTEKAGVPRASYLQGTFVNQTGGFLPAQSKVAYRFLFGKKDNNNNLLLGTASSREVVANTNQKVVVFFEQEITFNNSGTNPIVNGDYIIIFTKEGKFTFYFDATGTATPPYNVSTLGSVFVKVNVQGATTNPNDSAAIFANEFALKLSEYELPIISGTTVELKSKEEGSINQAITSGTRFTVGGVVNGSVTLGQPAVVDLSLVIPSNLDSTFFVQVYRSATITASQGLTLEDIDPGDELNLVYEQPLTDAIITAGVLTFQDTTPETFRASAVPLYSNEITGQGILQSNDIPPLALDIALFRGSMFYANTKTVHRLNFDALSVDDLVANRTRIIIANKDVVRFYTASNTEVLATAQGGDFKLSTNPSPSISIDETIRSLVKIINRDPLSPVYAFYLTGENDLPGKVLLEAKSIDDKIFFLAIESGYDDYDNTVSYSVNDKVKYNNQDYICIQNTPGGIPPTNTTYWEEFNISEEFNPQIPKSRVMERLKGETGGLTSVIKLTDHGFSTGDKVFVGFLSDGDVDAPPSFQGEFVIQKINNDEFRITHPIPASIDSSGPNPFLVEDSVVFVGSLFSDNLTSPNRIYFSKTSEPEAVPFSNFIDVGASDKEIKRILALRDNLFVMKDDGIFIVSGSSAPNFSVRLLDNARIIAPDSAVVLNNQIYVLTDQGITVVTDSGAAIISRGIENLITEITSKVDNFDINTFGIAYENDRAYILFMPEKDTDSTATIAYRYHIFERTWSQWSYPANCGHVMTRDNTLYIGNGDRSYISKERKNLDYRDYADRNFNVDFSQKTDFENTIVLSSTDDIEKFDAVVQKQDVSINYFNNRLLKKMDDYDTGLTPPLGGFFNNYKASFGDSMVTKVQQLNLYLMTLSPVFTAKTINISNLKVQVELLVDELNSASAPTSLKDYKKPISITYETYITNVDSDENTITYAQERPFLKQSLTIYKGYKKVVEYQPQHFGDPSALKQVREATLIFDQNNFEEGVMRFASDIEQAFTSVPFSGKGKGYWGDLPWGDPDNYWGGTGNDIPFRTIVPRGKQKCRYITISFEHNIGREGFRLIGISAVVRPISSRGYR